MNSKANLAILAIPVIACTGGDPVMPANGARLRENVTTVGNWAVGCNNMGLCVAIGAVAPRKQADTAERAALLIRLNNISAPARRTPLAFALSPVGSGGSLFVPEAEAARLRMVLAVSDSFEIPVRAQDGREFLVPGRDFRSVMSHFVAWQDKHYPAILSAEPVVVFKGRELPARQAPAFPEKFAAVCAEGTTDAGELWELGQRGKQGWLIRYTCRSSSPLVDRSLWFRSEAGGANLLPVRVEAPTDSPIALPVTPLDHADFNPETGELSYRVWFDPSGKCGRLWRYAFTAEGTTLSEKRAMPLCRGVDEEFWPQTYVDPALLRERTE